MYEKEHDLELEKLAISNNLNTVCKLCHGRLGHPLDVNGICWSCYEMTYGEYAMTDNCDNSFEGM